MSTTKESVEALLRKSPFSSSNQAALEAYVDAQAAGQSPYYMDANRTLFKLYQFFPQKASEDKVAMVLLLALLEFPSSDLLALRYLVPDRIQKTETCSAILSCASLLETCKFTDFWAAFTAIDGSDMMNKLVKASTEKLQRAILEVLALTYRTASLPKVLESLNMKSGDVLSKLNHPYVETVDGNVVRFVASADNTKRDRVFQEGVTYSAISSMMAKVSSE